MPFHKAYLSWALVLLALTVLDARRISQRPSHRAYLRNRNPIPLLRSVDSSDDLAVTGTMAPAPTSQSPKIVLLKPADVKKLESDKNSGRTFKHLLMAKGLFGSGCNFCGTGNGGGGGGGGGFGGGSGSGYFPYIIFNSPTNVTNVNDNNLINSVPTAPTTTTTARIRNRKRDRYSPQQALPMPIPMPVQMPTQVYQQRETQQFMNAMPAMMLNMNGQMIPVLLPANIQQLQGGNNRRRPGQGNRRHNEREQQQNGFNPHERNPFEILANSLKRIQYL